MPRNTRQHEQVWNSSASAVLFPASRSKVRTMLATGELVAFCKRCHKVGVMGEGKRCAGKTRPHELAYRTTEIFRDVDQTPASITANEMRALVGLKSAKAQKAARIKLDYWQQCGMNLRVLPAPQPFAAMSPA